jgi:hypothetical protein
MQPVVQQTTSSTKITGTTSPTLVWIFFLLFFGGAGWFGLRILTGEREANTALAAAVRAPIELTDETISVPATTARGIPLTLPYSGELRLEVNVVKGKHVNVYVIDTSAWNEFQQAHSALFGGKFHRFMAFDGTESKQLRRSGKLSEGNYYIIIENPTLGILVESSFDVAVKATLRP